MSTARSNDYDERHPALQRRLTRAAGGVLFERAAQELGERMDLLANAPTRIVCLGADAATVATCRARYPAASLGVIESNAELAKRARRDARRWLRRARYEVLRGRLDATGLPDATADLIVANLALARHATPDAAFREVARVLRPGGAFLFCIPGAESLRELRRAWEDEDGRHVTRFADIHDIGSALSRHGFTESVLDSDTLTLEYTDVATLWEDLTAHGARNVLPRRQPGLTGRHRFETMRRRLVPPDSPCPITVELVFAHTWRATQDSRDRSLGSGDVTIPITGIGRRS